MKIPSTFLEEWAKELIDECGNDRETRIAQYRMWRNIYYTGSNDDVPSKRNRCFSHVDKLSSYLFSPSDVHFDIDFDDVTNPQWSGMADKASNYFNRAFARSNSDVAFAQANEWALVKGACIVKQSWSARGLEPFVIQPEFFGVMRPDIEDLDRQDAFTHTFWLTRTQFRRMLGNHPDRAQIMIDIDGSFDAASQANLDGGYNEITSGGGYPLSAIGVPGVTNPQAQQYGVVDWTTNQSGPMLDPQVAARLVRVDDLWVWNDAMEDWTTLRYVNPGILIEGKLMHRNLSDAPHEHPFQKVCSQRVPNYFWGRSEIANIWTNQKLLSSTLNNIGAIFNLQAKPSRSVIGGAGVTDEKVRALLSPGGVLTEGNPTAKVDTYAPDMPNGFMEYLGYLDGSFDEAAGFTAIMQGQGEPGVRAGNHANTLMRTSTPRLRDRALVVEKQAASWGDLSLKIMRAKDASVLSKDGINDFVLDQLPQDASVVVDSHTSSPAFSGDNQELMFALARSGAIDGVSLIEGVHPPRQDVLVARLQDQEKSKAQQMDELKKIDPEQWAKAIAGTGRHR